MRAPTFQPRGLGHAAAVTALWFAVACSPQTAVPGPDNKAIDAEDTSIEDTAAADVPVADAASETTAADVVVDVGATGLWTQIALPSAHNVDLHGVWSDGTTRVVAVGTNGTIVTYDGLKWDVPSSEHFQTLNAVSGTPGAVTNFAVGHKGTIVQAAGKDGAPGKTWAVPGGCAKSADCDDGDGCTSDVCDGGLCQHTASGAIGCCGGLAFGDSFDKGLGKWVISDIKGGGIVWSAAAMTGKDGGKRATSPPKAAYFGRTDVPCSEQPGMCGTFDNGKVVGATMTSPEFQVPIAAKVTLSFQALLDVGSSYDQLTVTALPFGEVVWSRTQVFPNGSTDGEFKLQTVNLTKFGGKKIKLEIRFDTSTNADNGGEGVFLDDFAVASTCAPASGSGSGLTNATFFGTWAAADDDAWAVGDGGAIAHWDGAAWSLVDAGSPTTLRAVWGANGSDVWAVGEKGTILHNSGEGWVKTPIEPFEIPDQEKPYKVTSTLLAIWGAAPDDVWASGLPDSNGKGVFVHWDGELWTYAPIFMDEVRTVRALWGWSKDRILVAGTQGMVYVFDGQQTFQAQPSGTIATLFGIAGFGKDALFVGDIGTILRYTPLTK